MTLIRKFAAPLALLSILATAVAAPYLLPENPDSAVFRSGTLALLLMAACCHPVCQSLRRVSMRTLLCGAAFGLLLGSAMSLGAELRFYGCLLPGIGSMVRRLAVPVLVTPLLGSLAAYGMHAMQQNDSLKKTLRLPFWAYMAILLACWLPLLIAYYPGMLNYDFYTEYSQYLAGEWDNRHPLLYIVLCYGVFAAGDVLGQPELAVFTMTLLRMAVLAAALAYACIFAQRRNAPRWALLGMTACYALLPIFSVMSVSAAKDTPFAAAVLALSLLGWEALENSGAFLASKQKRIAFVLCVLFTWHMRKNGVAVLVLLPLLITGAKGFRLKMTRLCAVSAALAALLSVGMNAALHPVEQPSFQTYSLPAQQLARAYNLGTMSEAEREELRGFYIDSDWGLQHLPHLADAAKGSLDPDKLSQNGDAFMDLWTRVGRKNMRVYTEAFLLLNIGSWYPDDQTHANIYRPYGLDKGYLQTDEYDLSEHGIGKHNPLPTVRNLCERICRRNVYQKYPVIAQLFAAATPLWIILFSVFTLIAQRRGNLALASSGLFALHLSYLFGPCTLARYMLPLFCMAPVILMLALSPSGKR